MSLVVERHAERGRQAALDFIMRTRLAAHQNAEPLLKFWKEIRRREDELDDPVQAKTLVEQLKKDVDSLRELRTALRSQRNDPQASQSEQSVNAILRVLEAILDQLERRWWMLRARAWAQFNILNPAAPKRHPDHDKDKRKEREVRDPGREEKKEGA